MTPEALCADLGAWLDGAWDPALDLLEWRGRLVADRWLVPSWPARWHGREWPVWSDELVAGELAARGLPGAPIGSGMGLAGPTILAHGPDVVRERFLESILTGKETWCQLFSEPDAGSDLAGLTTRAELDGDEWVITGQKVWNTSAHHADLGMLLARTNWHVPKHAGITYFVLPMRQEGVTVRPLRQMNGHASFNQVFLTEARIPKDHVIGEVDGGWSVARTTLAHERRYGAMRPPSFGPSASASASANATPARAVEEARAEAARHFAPYVWYPQRAGRVDLLVERCRATGRDRDPIARQEVARVLSLHRVSGWTAERARANRAAGRPPGPEGSIGKLALSVVARAAARAHSLIAGSSALVVGGDAPLKGTISEVLLSVPAQSIAGGTDEIQRNIVAERILGLPREPSTVEPSLKGA